jgi:diadenosine tetraphosphatase ApaH/serine/threonine PP2A family protein phosphatase
MKIAVLSDVHANLEALEAVLADAKERGAEGHWGLGDIVGYGADPDAVVERMREIGGPAVAGNHDWAACGLVSTRQFNRQAALAAHWTARTMKAENLEWLKDLPLIERIDGTLIVHATPSEPAAWHYCMQVEDALDEMESYSENLCLIGHSHVPGAFERHDDEVRYTRAEEIVLHEGRQYMVNVGSVGQPRDGDKRAAYLLFDTVERRLRHVRVPYDIASAQRKILAAGLPPWLASRLGEGD